MKKDLQISKNLKVENEDFHLPIFEDCEDW